MIQSPNTKWCLIYQIENPRDPSVGQIIYRLPSVLLFRSISQRQQ